MCTGALMHRHPIDVIYLDYAKAFDTVPHQRLLRQIYSLGMHGTAINFTTAFLTGRQRVRVNRSYSTWKNVISGVPQGSVLGPMLFTLYVWDASQVVKCIVSMFVDDTKLYTVLTDRNSNLKLNPFATRSRSQRLGCSRHGTRSRCERLANLSRAILIIFQLKT